MKVLSVSERKSVSDLIDKIANIIKEKRRLNQWRNYHPIKRDEIKDSKQKTLLKSRKRGNQQKMEKDDNETQSRNNKETKIQNEKKDIIQIQSQMLNILSKAKYSPVIINQESFKIIDDKNISKQSNFVSQSQFEILSNKKEYILLSELSIQEQFESIKKDIQLYKENILNETIKAKEKQLPIITKPESFIIQNYPIKQINESEEGIDRKSVV